MLENLHINALQERVQELDPASKEAKECCKELARRFRDGIGVMQNPEEAQYWEARAGGKVNKQVFEPAVEEIEPIQIDEYLKLTPFLKRRAAQAQEPAGMYSYALYLEGNQEQQAALEIHEKLVELLEKEEHIDDSRRRLLGMTKLAIGRLYRNGKLPERDVEESNRCIKEAALELKHLAAFPDLINVYRSEKTLDTYKADLMWVLSDIKIQTPAEMILLAKIYTSLNEKMYAAVYYHGAFLHADATPEQQQEAQEALGSGDLSKLQIWQVWQAVCSGDSLALYDFSLCAGALEDYGTEMAFLQKYLESYKATVKEAEKIPDAYARMAQCYKDGLGVAEDKATALEVAKKGADMGNQECRWFLYSAYWQGCGCEQNKNWAVESLEEFADKGDMSDKLRAAEEYAALGYTARAVIWCQEVLAEASESYDRFLAYNILCRIHGSDHLGQAVTPEYLEKRAEENEPAAMFAWINSMLLQEQLSQENADHIKTLVDRSESTEQDPRWEALLHQAKERVREFLENQERQREEARIEQRKLDDENAKKIKKLRVKKEKAEYADQKREFVRERILLRQERQRSTL